jgi:hypothetical protein
MRSGPNPLGWLEEDAVLGAHIAWAACWPRFKYSSINR